MARQHDSLPALETADICSIKAVYQGNASDIQQKRAMDVIIKKFLKIGSLSFDRDPYVTAFNEGQRNAGLQIVHIVSTSLDVLTARAKKRGE